MNKILTFPFRHPLGDCTNNGLTSVGDNFDLYFDVEDVDNIQDETLLGVELPKQMFHIWEMMVRELS